MRSRFRFCLAVIGLGGLACAHGIDAPALAGTWDWAGDRCDQYAGAHAHTAVTLGVRRTLTLRTDSSYTLAVVDLWPDSLERAATRPTVQLSEHYLVLGKALPSVVQAHYLPVPADVPAWRQRGLGQDVIWLGVPPQPVRVRLRDRSTLELETGLGVADGSCRERWIRQPTHQ